MRFLTFFCVHHIVFMFCSFIIPHIPSPTALSLLLLPNFSLRDSFLNQFCIGHLSCCVHGTSHWVMSRRHFIVPHPLILGVFPPLLQCSVGLRVGGNDVPFRTKCSAVSPSIKVGLFHCSISHACFFLVLSAFFRLLYMYRYGSLWHFMLVYHWTLLFLHFLSSTDLLV